ncbi:hypothetical protein ACJA23_02090 [Mycoplasma corogypsi]|uniref:hypothetical protein n=1 Tax=Mycoplasma corogypsi TaxID=2106 RepID=UPI0038738E5E
MKYSNNTSYRPRPKLTREQRIQTIKRILQLVWESNKAALIFAVIFMLLSNIGMIYNQIFMGKIILGGFLEPYTKDIIPANLSFD